MELIKIENVISISKKSSERRGMKIAEKIDYGFEREQKFRSRYSFVDKDSTIKRLENQEFVVPWQIIEKEKRGSFME